MPDNIPMEALLIEALLIVAFLSGKVYPRRPARFRQRTKKRGFTIMDSRLLLIVAFGAIAPPIQAQRASTDTVVPFDTSVTVISKKLLVPIEAVLKRFTQTPRGEFETTTDYNARLATALPVNRWYAIPKEPSIIVYDADSAEMSVMAWGSDIPGVGCTIDMKQRNTSLGAYRATNPLGVKVTVKKSRFERWAVLVPEKNTSNKCYGATAAFSVPPTEAAPLKARLGMAIIVHAAPGEDGAFTGHDDYMRKPTLTDPLDIDGQTDWLVVDNLSIWLYDKRSGAVIRKRTIGTADGWDGR